jgi:hypothetical protein
LQKVTGSSNFLSRMTPAPAQDVKQSTATHMPKFSHCVFSATKRHVLALYGPFFLTNIELWPAAARRVFDPARKSSV